MRLLSDKSSTDALFVDKNGSGIMIHAPLLIVCVDVSINTYIYIYIYININIYEYRSCHLNNIRHKFYSVGGAPKHGGKTSCHEADTPLPNKYIAFSG